MHREARTYTLAVVVEPDDGLWHAWCPTLLGYGAATWGATRGEALGHLREVVGMVVERMAEAGAPVPAAPEAPDELGQGLAAEQVVVTVGGPAG